MITDEGLKAFANLLSTNGFKVYEPKSQRVGNYISFSRVATRFPGKGAA